jgi:hypothetical protein
MVHSCCTFNKGQQLVKHVSSFPSTLHSAHELRHSDLVFSLFICTFEIKNSDPKVCQSCAVI